MPWEWGWAHGGAPGLVRRKRRGKRGGKPLLWFLQEGMNEAGLADLGLAGLNNFSRPRAKGLSLSVWDLPLRVGR